MKLFLCPSLAIVVLSVGADGADRRSLRAVIDKGYTVLQKEIDLEKPKGNQLETRWNPVEITAPKQNNELVERKTALARNLQIGNSYGGYSEEFRYYEIPSPGGGCIKLKDGDTTPGEKLILGSCDYSYGLPGLTTIWRVDDDGMIHSALDDAMCMQAGYNGKHDDGVIIRIDDCDSRNAYQNFTWNDYEAPITPTRRPDLCVVSQGVTADLEEDLIILKKCDEISEYRLEFSGDVAEEHYGRFCPGGYGGDWGSYEYDCYVCEKYSGGGICIDNEEKMRRAKDKEWGEEIPYFEDLCDEMNEPGAGRLCGDELCETENYCVNCSKYLGHGLTGFLCIDEDVSTSEFLGECIYLNEGRD